MNILITTLWFYDNFGSVLQAYALKKYLSERYKAEVDFLPFRPKLPEYNYFFTDDLKKQYEEKKKKFESFRKESLGIETSIEVIGEKWKKYDINILGSDIVWGREFSLLDPTYFLDFADNKKIVYAASVLLDKGKTEDDDLFKKELVRFDHISVRETSARQTIERLANKNVSTVLDPTLLLNAADYPTTGKGEYVGERYLLSYFLTHDPAVVEHTNIIAKKMGLKVIHFFADYPYSVFPNGSENFTFAGPLEFIDLVKNATMIFTNSFHGTCFSMVFRKPFYTYMAKRSMLSRVRDTVTRLHLTDRFYSDIRDIDKVTLNIDYSEFEKALKEERNRSAAFLDAAIL